MKKLITALLLTLLIVNNAKSQTNDFKIGIVPDCDQGFTYVDPTNNFNGDCFSGNIFTPSKWNTNYSSIFSLLAADGFNNISTAYPFKGCYTKLQFKQFLALLKNNGQKLTIHCVGYYQLNTTNNLNTWSNVYNVTNNIDNYRLKHTDLINAVKNDANKDVLWGINIAGESDAKGPYYTTTADSLGECWNGADTKGQIYPNFVNAAAIYFGGIKTDSQKLLNCQAPHGSYLGKPRKPGDPLIKPEDFINIFPATDVAYYDAAYYHSQFHSYTDLDINERKVYLGKFINIDFVKPYYKNIYTEIDVGDNYYRLTKDNKNPPVNYKWNENSNIDCRNYNYVWFQAYTSIIHGVKGVSFWDIQSMYSTNADPNLEYWPDELNATNMASYWIPNRFSTNVENGIMPYDYRHYLRFLAQELAYLKKNNFLSDDPKSIIYSKTTTTDLMEILPAVNTYLPENLDITNARDLFKVKETLGLGTPTPHNPNHEDEFFGLRYTLRTNTSGNEVIMIISNPNPVFIDNVTLSFDKVANPIVRNATSVDFLFENKPTITTIHSMSYKTTRNSTISLTNNSVGVYQNVLLSNKKLLGLAFGPFDVHILKFRNSTNTPPVEGYNNGWDKVWSNNGSGNIEDWHFKVTDQKVAGDFNGDGKEELLMIQNPNIIDYSSWVNMYDYTNGKWYWNWSNNGNDHIGTTSYWTIGQYDRFYVGNFVKETTGTAKKDELLIIKQDPSIPNGGGNIGLYSFNGSSWVEKWKTTSGVLGWWGLKKDDKWIVGNFDNDIDKIDDLLSVQASSTSPNWSQIHKYNSSSGSWENLYSNSNNGVSTGKIGSWNIISTDQFYAGKFTGPNESYLLCFQGNGPTNKLLKFTTGSWGDTGYSNTLGSLGGIAVGSINYLTDKFLVGGIDGDTKDEFFEIQRGSNAGSSKSIDLNETLTAWNSNWTACNPYPNYPFIDDWSINDQGGNNTDYLLIKAVSTDPKYLMAFRSFGTYNNYLVSMYKSNTFTNKSASIQTAADKLSNNKDLNIYPNPASSNIVFESKNNEQKNYVITLSNVHGQEILLKSITFSNIYNLDITNIENGIYILTLRNDKEEIVKKIVVQK